MPRGRFDKTLSKPTLLSVFSGAGGLDLGLERAGFQAVGLIEVNRDARQTLKANRPAWPLFSNGDVVQVAKEITPADVGLKLRKLGVLAGGPPCQPYSAAAQWAETGRSGLRDPRSKSLAGFLRLVETFLPEVVLIENVPGFVTGRSSALSFIESAFSRINKKYGTKYRIHVRLVRADEYGVPQKRRRAILIVRRDGRKFQWPTPTHRNRPVRAFDAIWDSAPQHPPMMRGRWAALLPTIPAGQNYLYHTRRGNGLRLFGNRSWFWSFLLKLAPGEPSWTIPASAGSATGPFHWDNRPLTVNERARLQSFPKSWAFSGGVKSQERQIGNATPPLLAEVIGRALMHNVFARVVGSRPTLSIRRRRKIPSPPEPIPVPQPFLLRVDKQPDHPGAGGGPGALRRRLRHLNQLAEALHELLAQRSAAQFDIRSNGSGVPTNQSRCRASLRPKAQPRNNLSGSRIPKRGSRATLDV
jgi:DNA (cytosine-5)-methyltransferase 1